MSENEKPLSAAHSVSVGTEDVRAAAERRARALTRIGVAAASELQRAVSKHAPMQSAHHGYAVILEELDELWSEIKQQKPDKARLREEALQVAAMGMRFVLDVCGGVE